MANPATTPADIELIDESSLRLAVVQHLASGLASFANKVEFVEGKTDIKVLVNGQEQVFAVNNVSLGAADDLGMEVALTKWKDGEAVAGLVVHFRDYAKSVVVVKYFSIEV